MKTILYATLSVDGYIGQAGEGRSIPKAILTNFMQMVGTCGNLIIGRRTYDLMYGENAGALFSGVELMVVSTSLQTNGVQCATSPQSALQHLNQKGFESALIGGGAQLDSAFLSNGLVDELYLNIDPRIANKGIRLTMADGFESDLKLMETTHLGENIVQLHYAVER